MKVLVLRLAAVLLNGCTAHHRKGCYTAAGLRVCGSKATDLCPGKMGAKLLDCMEKARNGKH